MVYTVIMIENKQSSTKQSIPFIHRIYQIVRPLLYKSGILTLARRLFPSDLRLMIAQKIGLSGFDVAASNRQALYHNLRVPRKRKRFFCEGINLVGDLRVDIGLGEATRLIIQATQHGRYPIAYTEVAAPLTARTQHLPSDTTQGTPYDFTLIHANPSEFIQALESLPSTLLQQSYRAAFWYWELPKFPAQWHYLFDFVDEIWVASRFTQEIIAKVSPVPVMQIPLPIVVQAQFVSRSDYDLPDNRFVFLYSFSPTSTIGRKNPFAVIEAYRKVFLNEAHTPLLVIKTHHLDTLYGEKVATPLRQEITSVGGILIEDNLSRQDMTNLLSLSDCYISLHRSEGFGLGIAESMALGKPVIATAYSGNMDYMTPSNSYPVRYNLREITIEDHQYYPEMSQVYEIGQLWAEPDIEHASQLMRHVFEHQDEAHKIGQQAQVDIQRDYSLTATAQAIQQHLNDVKENPNHY